MFQNVQCTIPKGAIRQSDRRNKQFIQTILEEDRQVKNLRAQEIKSTVENPRIREQHEITDISSELRTQKHNKLLEQKRRQQIRQNNVDLRQLQTHLRAAVCSKQLAEQKAEKDREKEEWLKKKRKEDEEYEAERLRHEQRVMEQEKQEKKKKEHFRAVLQKQIEEANDARRKDRADVLRDREEMQKLLNRFNMDHKMELAELERRKQAAKKEMEEFMRAQEEYRQQQRDQNVDENARNLERMQKYDDDKAREKEKKRKEHERREVLSNKIGQHLHEIESEKRKHENLLLDLLVEERNTKEDLRHRQILEKQKENFKQMRQQLELYRLEKIHREEQRQKEEDESIRIHKESILAEQDRIEQLTKDLRRQKIKEHGIAIQEMIDNKRRQRGAEAAVTLEQHELNRQIEKEEEALVDAERRRLLSSISPDILRYLPSGTIRESEREFLSVTKPKRNV